MLWSGGWTSLADGVYACARCLLREQKHLLAWQPKKLVPRTPTALVLIVSLSGEFQHLIHALHW
jgi:hypothetical protein